MATIADQIKFIITGDNSGLVKATAQSDSAIEKMTQSGSRNLQGLLLGFAGLTGGAFAFGTALKTAVGEALDSERVFRALSVAVNASGDSWKAQEQGIRGFLTAFQETTRFTDEEGARALQVLIQSGMGVTQALSLMNTVADLAAANQQDLAAAAEVVGRAFNGGTEALRRWNVFIADGLKDSEKFGAAIAKINETMAGQAKLTKTASDQWALFKKNLLEAGENIGKVLLPGLGALAEALNNLTNAEGWKKKPDKNSILGMIFSMMGLHGLAAGQFLKSAQQNILFGPPPPPKPGISPIDTASKEVLKREAEERAKTLFDALKIAKDAYYEDVARDEEELEQQRIEGLEASFRFDKQQQERAAANRRQDINDLINNAHRFAFELGRVLGEAAENFIHQMIEGLSTIGANLKALKAGGIGGIAGGLGIAGTIFGVVGSIVDMFSSGAEQIRRSNVEVVRAIREWIDNLRGATKAELGATTADIGNALREIAKLRDLGGILDKDQMEQFTRSIAESLDGFIGVEGAFERQFGRKGGVEEVLQFWLQMIKEQGSTFAIIASGLKSVEDVKAFLKDQTQLSYSQGRQFIEFFTSQNQFTPEQQRQLFEDLLIILNETGNITTSELISLTEIIRQLREETGDANIQEERQLQITRSVAGITENQANLVVGHLSTINAVIQSIYELMQRAMDNFTAAAGAIPAAAGGVVFGPGAIVVNGGANATAREIVDVLSTDLRAKGVKI